MQEYVKDFVAFAYPLAEKVNEMYGIPPLFCIAQAALETGWGRSVNENNYFGHTGKGTTLKTREEAATKAELIGIFTKEKQYYYNDTVRQLENGRWEGYGLRSFKTFETPLDSFMAYGQNLASNQVYGYAWSLKATSEIDFIKEVCKKYATAADYGNTIISIMGTVKRALNELRTEGKL